MPCPARTHFGEGGYKYSERLRIELRNNRPYLHCVKNCSPDQIAKGLGVGSAELEFDGNGLLQQSGARTAVERLKAYLISLGYPITPEGGGWKTYCPAHEGDFKTRHHKSPSLKVDAAPGKVLIICQSQGCDYTDICKAIELPTAALFDNWKGGGMAHPIRKDVVVNFPATLTIIDFVQVKKLPEQFLLDHGVKRNSFGGAGLRFSYDTIDGKRVAYKERAHLHLPEGDESGKRMGWPKGKEMLAYQLPQIKVARASKEKLLAVCEGESDPLTCIFCGIPTIGLPGSTHWKKLPVEEIMRCQCGHFETKEGRCAKKGCGCTDHTSEITHLLIIQDNDTAGAVLTRNLLRILKEHNWQSRVSVVTFPAGVKDASDLWTKHCLQVKFDDASAAQIKTAKIEFIRRLKKLVHKIDLAEVSDEEPETALTEDLSTLHDVGNVARMLAAHGPRIRWCAPLDCWLLWDGKRWKPDRVLEIDTLAIEVVRRIQDEIPEALGEERKKALFKHYVASNNKQKISAMLNTVKSAVPVTPNELDTNHWLLNFNNGVVDLRTGKMSEHDPNYYITRLIPVDYNPKAECKVFRKFLEDVFPNPQIRRYVHLAAGYSATGSQVEKAIFIAIGSGDNGKSKFLHDALEYALGDIDTDGYALTSEATILVNQWNARDASPDLAKLRGARLTIVDEIEKGVALNEARLKKLTGGDTVTAKALYRPPETFKPAHHIWLQTNDLPVVRGTNRAIWKRLKPIPFNTTFTDAPKGSESAPTPTLETSSGRNVRAWPRGWSRAQSYGASIACTSQRRCASG